MASVVDVFIVEQDSLHAMASGKSKKRKSGGPEAAERKRQRLEQRRQEKAEAQARRRKAEARARVIRTIGIVALIGLAFWFFFLRTTKPTEIEGHPISSFAGEGLNDHVDGTVNYEMSPPVEGAHADNPSGCGVFSSPVINENFVHSLEHGAVGLLYDPTRAAPEDIKELEAIAAAADRNVLSAPYEGMETVFSITSWSRRMDLNDLDLSAVNEYVDTFAGKGPEPGKECPNTSSSPFVPEAEPSAEPSESPTEDGG